MPPAPFFHEASAAVRFWVRTDAANYVGATIGRHTLHYLFEDGPAQGDPVDLYLKHHLAIDDAVRRRCAGGSLEPVMLREADLARQPRA